MGGTATVGQVALALVAPVVADGGARAGDVVALSTAVIGTQRVGRPGPVRKHKCIV